MSRALPLPALAAGLPWRRDLAWTLATLLGLLVWEVSGLDLPLQRLVGDAQGFAWGANWLTKNLLHEGGRLLAGAVLLGMIALTWRPPRLGPSRAAWGWALGATVLCLLAIPGLKRVSQTSCPWNLAEFGGTVPYVPHWLPGLVDGGPGHCFPSGHAVSAFAFFSLYFLWRDHRPQVARACLAAVLVLGALYSWGQYARGAHFVSHSLWSAWVSWALCAGVAAASAFSLRRPATAAC